MSASPALSAVTRPVFDTVATVVLEDCQVACEVTLCVVPFDSAAVALNCEAAPTFGAVPPIDTEVTVGAVGVEVVGEPPQALSVAAAMTTPPRVHIRSLGTARSHRSVDSSFEGVRRHTVRGLTDTHADFTETVALVVGHVRANAKWSIERWCSGPIASFSRRTIGRVDGILRYRPR